MHNSTRNHVFAEYLKAFSGVLASSKCHAIVAKYNYAFAKFYAE